jgi:hypothetical protein
VAKFPEPPGTAELQALGPAYYTLKAGTLIWRVYFRGGPHPTNWNAFRSYGPTDSRFDHHLLPRRSQSRAILYAARFGPTCLAEVFQATRTIDRNDRDPWLVGFRVTRDVKLLNLTDAWVTRVGASTAIHSGSRARARRWSSAFHAAFPDIEGIAYCSSMDGNRDAFAFFERATSFLPAAPDFHRALSDPAMTPRLDGAAMRFGYVLV